MGLDLEQRLRRDLLTLDELPLGSTDRISAAAHAASARSTRRNRLAVAAAAVLLIIGGGALIWSLTTGPDELATSDSTSPSDTTVDTSETPLVPAIEGSAPPTSAPATTLPGPPVGAWQPISGNPNGVVLDPAVAWTGDAALVVGGHGLGGEPVAGTAKYIPATETWEPIAPPPPAFTTPVRVDSLSVWTGTQMLVIGGHTLDETSALGQPLDDGFAYDLATDSWRTIATEPGNRIDDRRPWAWTGSELLVWPEIQGDGEPADTSARAYDPTTDTWRMLPAAPIAPRQDAASVWTGSEWVIWGGTDLGQELGDGAAYDPDTNNWRTIAESPLSARRIRGAWTGEEMIVAGGSSGGDPVTGNGEFAHSDGAAYDPKTDTWRSIATWSAPHPGAQPLWTGHYIVLFAKGSAVIYDPAANRWYPDCCSRSTSSPVVTAAPIWTGTGALTISADPDPTIGGWLLTFSSENRPPTEPPPTTSVTSPSDPLANALTMLDAGVDSAPPGAIRLGDADLCGVEEPREPGTLEEWDSLEQSRRCFLDRHVSVQPAVFIEQRTTTEGDPIVTVWRTLADGTVEQHIDATRDRFGSGVWELVTCGRLTTSTPDGQVDLPPTHFSCGDTLELPLTSPSAPMPDWFAERRPELPLCGFEIGDTLTERRQCFVDAVHDGAGAEYVIARFAEEGTRTTLWLRSLGDGTYEIIEWRSAGWPGGDPPSAWANHTCSTIQFADAARVGTSPDPEPNCFVA